MAGHPYTAVAADSPPATYVRVKFLQSISGAGLTPTAGATAVHPGFKAGDYAFVLSTTAARLAALGQAVEEVFAVPTIDKIDDF